MNMRDKMVADARRGWDKPEQHEPYLEIYGERERIVIPSPRRSSKLVRRMHAYGFTFKAGPGQWVRFTDQKLHDKLWSSKHWLELAGKCYQEAYNEAKLFTEA